MSYRINISINTAKEEDEYYGRKTCCICWSRLSYTNIYPTCGRCYAKASAPDVAAADEAMPAAPPGDAAPAAVVADLAPAGPGPAAVADALAVPADAAVEEHDD